MSIANCPQTDLSISFNTEPRTRTMRRCLACYLPTYPRHQLKTYSVKVGLYKVLSMQLARTRRQNKLAGELKSLNLPFFRAAAIAAYLYYPTHHSADWERVRNGSACIRRDRVGRAGSARGRACAPLLRSPSSLSLGMGMQAAARSTEALSTRARALGNRQQDTQRLCAHEAPLEPQCRHLHHLANVDLQRCTSTRNGTSRLPNAAALHLPA